jgi:hypothetical protein
MSERLVRWFVFSVVIALLPLGFRYLLEATDGAPPTITRLLSQGELLLVSSAIAAAAVGELIGRGRRRPILQLFAGGGCIATVLIASLYFAYVSTRTAARPTVVATTSVWLFVLTLIASASCVILAEEER